MPGDSTYKRIRVRLKANDFDSLVRTFKSNLSLTGLFIKTTRPLSEGARVQVELLYSSGASILRGHGVVEWVRDAGESRSVAMNLEWDPPSRELVVKVLSTPTLSPPPLAEATSSEPQVVEPPAELQESSSVRSSNPLASTVDIVDAQEPAADSPAPSPSDSPSDSPRASDVAQPALALEPVPPAPASAEAPSAAGAPPALDPASGSPEARVPSGVWGWLKKTFS